MKKNKKKNKQERKWMNYVVMKFSKEVVVWRKILR